MIGCDGGCRGVHYARAIWLNLVRDARREACVEGSEGVSELCVDLIDTYVEYGMKSCEKPCCEVLGYGVERVR